MHVTPDIILFNKYIKEEMLSTVTSLITENTLAFNSSPVYVDHEIQSVESGGWLADQIVQTEEYHECLNFKIHLYTYHCISTTINCESCSQTIITIKN